MKKKIGMILSISVLFSCLSTVCALEETAVVSQDDVTIVEETQTPTIQEPSPLVITPGIIEIDGNKYYINEDGSYHLGFKEIDGNLYFFSRWGGAMRTGVFDIDGTLYGFGQDGIALEGLYTSNNQTYYFIRGKAQTGFQTINGQLYYFVPETGVMYKGTMNIDGVDYGFNEDGTAMNGLSTYQGSTYYGENGKLYLGFKEMNGNLYFFSRWGGAMRTGVFDIDGILYGFNEDGSAMNGLSTYQGSTYYGENGKIHLGFKDIDGKTYFFSRWGGAMRTGVFDIDGTLYGFNEDGTVMNGLSTYQGSTYYGENGKIHLGFKVIDGKKYFFSRWGGAMRTGVFDIDGTLYGFNEDGSAMNGLSTYQGSTYYGENGKIHLGFKDIDGKTYFFSRWGGAMRTGVFDIDGTLYGFNEDGTAMNGLSTYQGSTYYGENGKIHLGFKEINGKTYFFSRWGGAMRTGIFDIDGTVYGFKDDGTIMVGWTEYQGQTYFFNKDGSRYSGFQTINGKHYFFSQIDGTLKHGWFWYQGYHYYATADGSMAVGDVNIDGMTYHFTDLGRLKLGWSESNGKTYFLDENAKPVTDWQVIDGVKCFFNSLGELIKKDAKYIIDVSTHQKQINWDQVKAQGLVDGVIVRVGYGSFYEDEWLAYNISELKRLGIPYGIYIFSYAENGTEAYNEANGVLNMIQKYGLNPTLGIYYDIEDWDLGYANSNNISVEMYDTIITTFINRMKENGYTSYVYTNLSYTRNRLSSAMKQYVRWIAQYNHTCNYDGEYFMWQYSSTERVDGISTNVDSNVWFN